MENDKLILSDEDKRSILGDVETERQKVRDFRLQRNSILETDAPDDVAYDLKKSQELGVPRIAIAGDRDSFRREDEVSKQRAYRESAPRFSEWLDNPDNYAVARDDTESMGVVEQALRGTPKLAKAAASNFVSFFRSSPDRIKQQYYSLESDRNERDQDFRGILSAPFYGAAAKGRTALIDRLKKEYPIDEVEPLRVSAVGYEEPTENRLARYEAFITGEADQVEARFKEMNGGRLSPESVKALESQSGLVRTNARLGLEGMRLARETPESDGRVQDWMISAGTSIGRMIPAIVVGAITKSPSASGAVIGGDVYTQSYDHGLRSGLSSSDAAEYAFGNAAIELVTERFALGSLFNKSGSDGMLKRFLKYQGKEQFGEQFATFGQDLTDIAYIDTEKTLKQFMDERLSRGIDTAMITLIASSAIGGTFLAAERGLKELDKRAQQAHMTDGEKRVNKVMDAADKSALRARSPEKFQDALERIADKTDAETMVVDLDGLAEALEQSDVDLREAAAEFGATPEELQQAFDMGGEFNVKTAALLNSKLARENREALQDNIRLESDALTPAQRRKEIDAINTEMDAELNRMGEDIKDAVTREDMELQVRELIAEQIGGTDVYSDGVVEVQARAMEAMVSTLATRLNISPVEAFQQLAPRLRGVVAGEVREADIDPAALEQAATEGYEGSDTGEAVGWLRAKAKGLDMSTEARMQRAREMGFDTDVKLYHSTDAKFDSFALQDKRNTLTGNRVFGDGFYFTPDKGRAEIYGKRLVTAYTSLKNPKIITAYTSDHVNVMNARNEIGSDGLTKKFQADGHDGVIFQDSAGGIDQVVIFDPSNIRSVNAAFDPDLSSSSNLLAQSAKRTPRGAFDPTRNEITLFEGANLSTLMHESAHWYFDTLLRLEADGNAPAFITKQLDEVFKWGGVARGTAIYDENGKPTNQGRELHEAFAETFEAYLQDGKAPSAKLRDVFRAFKAWLTQLYRKLDPRTRANLTPEIREVFDRMMAVDDQITAATKQFEQTADQMAQSLLDRGIITERQFKNAKKRLGDAREKAKEELMARLMDDVTRTEKQWWNSELSRVKGEVIREFDRSPVGRAMAWLGENVYKGDVPEGKIPTNAEALMYQAREAGYQGESRGEAVEWLRAVEKGLDMSTEARMARAAEMGFDTSEELYHGSTHNIREFSDDRGNPENHHGVGAYFTNDPSDAGRNYASQDGSDLTNRIEQRAERLESDLEYDESLREKFGLNEDSDFSGFAREQAKRELSGENLGASYPAFVKLDNPVTVNGVGRDDRRGANYAPTFWEAKFEYFEDVDEYGDLEGEAVDLVEAARRELDDIGFDQTDEVVGQLYEELFNNEGISADAFEAIMRGEPATYMIGYEGSPGQIIQNVYRAIGHDGIKLMDADRQFSNMGMNYGAEHTVIFDPSNIRSVNAAFDPDFSDSANLLAQENAMFSGARQDRYREEAETAAREKELQRQLDEQEISAAEYEEQMRSAGWLMQDYEQGVPAFYSALERFVEGVNQPKAPADQWKAMIAKAPGIKAEEVEWTGINDILDNAMERGRADGKGKTITKEELLEVLRSKGVKVETITATELGESAELTFDDEGRMDDDESNWQHRSQDTKSDVAIGVDQYGLVDRAIDAIRKDEARYIRSNMDPDDLEQAEADLSGSIVDDWIRGNFPDEIDNLVEEYAEEVAREAYFEDPIYEYDTIGDSANLDLVIRGNGEYGYEVLHDGVVVVDAVYSVSEARIRAQEYAETEEIFESENSPTAAKWGEYITDGDSTNYRELKLTLPDNPGKEFVYSSHYSDPNIVAFMRVTDRRLRTEQDVNDIQDAELELRWEPWVGRAAQGDDFGRTGDIAVVVNGEARKRVPSSLQNFEHMNEVLASYRDPSSLTFNQGQTITRFDDGSAVKIKGGRAYTERIVDGSKNAFFLEELQSDWHQQGRQKSYDNDADKARAKKMWEKLSVERDDAYARMTALGEKSKSMLGSIYDGGAPEVSEYAELADWVAERNKRFVAGLDRLGVKNIRYFKESSNPLLMLAEMLSEGVRAASSEGVEYSGSRISNDPEGQKFFTEYAAVGAEGDAAYAENSEKRGAIAELSIKLENAVPDAPFKGDAWINLSLKKALMTAVEEGKSAFAWADAQVVKERWSDRYAELYENIYDRKLVKFVRKLTKQSAKHFTLDGDPYTKEDAEDGVEGYWIIEITPELKDKIAGEGFALFQSGGNPKGWGETAPPTDLPPMRLNLSAVREAYGEDAVRKLPHAVRKRAASSNDVNDMLQNVKSVRDTLKAKPPASLFKFIRSKKVGGIKEGNHSAGDVRSIMDDNYSLINNKSGRDLDYVREMAEEAGYISSKTDEYGRTSIQDLLDALAKEAGGEPVYSEQDAEQANNHENAQRWKEWFEDNGVDVFEDSKPTLRKQVEALITSTSDGAVDADSAAEVFGFSSGEAMLAAMAEIGSRGKHVNAEAKRRMAEEFGDPFNDGSLAEKARLYAENEVRVRQTEIELAALNDALGRNAASNRAKEMARERLSEMTVKQVSRYNAFRDNEQRWSRAALEAVEKGDMTNAMIYKQRQLVNMHLYREGEKLSQKLDKVQRELRKYETVKSRRAKIAPDYMERIDDLLSAYELRISKQGRKEQERRASVAAWVSEMIAEGREAEIAPEASLLAEAADLKTWQSLTVDEASYLKATIENLAHLGKRKAQLLSDRDKREFNAVIDELVETLEAAGPVGGKLTPLPSREQSHRPTAGERVSGELRKYHAWLMRPEHQFRALDGKDNGPLWNALFRSFSDAADMESSMSRDSAKAVRKAYNIYSSRERYVMHNVGIEIPELGKPIGQRWTKMDVISMALNWGVEYNRQALIEGYGWNAEQVEAALNRLMTNKDWDFVEAIWEESGRYKKEAFALEKAMTGVEPKAVEGVTFTLPSGRVIEGKYYHLEYDGRQIGKASNRQKVQDEREALSSRMRSTTKPQTRNGALKERVGSGGKPVKLNISVFERSVMETIHDIAYRKAIIDASRIVTNDRFREAYQRASGMEAYDQLMPWLETIATEKTDQVQGMASILQTMRRNLPISYMGYKVGTAMIQWTGALAGIPEVGHKYFAQGVAKSFFGNPLSVFGAWQAVSEKSEFMRDRPMGYDRDVREITSQMGAANPLGDMRRNAFILISAMDIAVSTPLWTAGYDKALAGKIDGIERGNEDDAISYADSLIRRTQTAGRNQDLARVSRDSELWKSVTMIFGYFSNLYAFTSQKVRAVRSGEINPIEFAYFATILFVAIPLLAEMSAGRLLADDDDDESLASKSGDAVISNFAGMFPVIRDMVNYKLKPEYGYNMSPVASGMEDAAQTFNALLETAIDGEEFTEADTKRAVRALGGILGIPSSQLVITGDYLWDVMQDEEDPIEEPERIFTEGLLRNTN